MRLRPFLARIPQWPGGFTANITITDDGTSAISGWTLVFSFLPPGGGVQFGFEGTYTSNDSPPTAFTVNGIPSS